MRMAMVLSTGLLLVLTVRDAAWMGDKTLEITATYLEAEKKE